MKKKFLIAVAICASLFVVAPAVSAAEVEPEVQTQNEQSNIGVAPCADEIVMKFRINVKTKQLQYRRWNQTRGYWVDKDWITLK